MKSIFMGKVLQEEYWYEKRYYLYYDYLFCSSYFPKPLQQYYVDSELKTNFKNYEKFYECNIDKNSFSIGETVDIEPLNIKTKILNVIRSIEDGDVYECDYIIKIQKDPNENKKRLLVKELEETLSQQRRIREEQRNELLNERWKLQDKEEAERIENNRVKDLLYIKKEKEREKNNKIGFILICILLSIIVIAILYLCII